MYPATNYYIDNRLLLITVGIFDAEVRQNMTPPNLNHEIDSF